MDDKILKLKNAVDKAKNIVVFTGAGFSTESGIPDFRSSDGIYNRYADIRPEELLSAETLRDKPELFYDFYINTMVFKGIKPNIAHCYFAELEKNTDKNISIITQNIDGLHQLAGSRNVIELHGSAESFYCVRCGEKYDSGKLDTTKFSGTPPLPRCDKCGSMVRPDVVLYNEMLDEDKLHKAMRDIANADLVIEGGTSLKVYPASALLRYCDSEIFIINRDKVDASAFVFSDNITYMQSSLGDVFGALSKMM